ncbi:MarR family winged helix-turn-helix transcriptional regulator [Spirillospora sp. CA-294931]|uniref:MarR family winged helix-turn-helix transcriptional regulator n=1 Tax=Spirillospora sp. CA-294931 TaxID=3240042 RepID=UPI003D91C320
MQIKTQRRVDPLVTGVHDRWEEHGLPGAPWAFMALCSLGRLQHVLSKALETELKKHGLGRTGYFLLTTLALTDSGHARLSTLGRMLLIHPTSVKLTVDQLETAGLVERRRHPSDGRATLVAITDEGRRRAADANASLESSDSELARLAGMHEELFEALQPARMAVGDDAI